MYQRSLLLRLKILDLDRGLIWTASGDTVRDWERATIRLPAAYYRIVIEATAEREGVPTNVALDDVVMDECDGNKVLMTVNMMTKPDN